MNQNELGAEFTAPGAGETEALRAEVRELRGRLEALRDASLSLTSDPSLSARLGRIVDVSRGATGARYGALAVHDPPGHVVEFVASGVTAAEREYLGSPPIGRGLLGLMVQEGQSIRIADIAQDPRRAGFPPGHPPMRSL